MDSVLLKIKSVIMSKIVMMAAMKDRDVVSSTRLRLVDFFCHCILDEFVRH